MRSLLALCLLATAASASALIVNGDPGGPPPEFLNYVGTVSDASGVYLGEHNGAYWVLTADHVAGKPYASFTIGGTAYTVVTDSGMKVGEHDLYLFRIEVAPESPLAGLAPLSIAANSFSGGDVYMAGNGGSGQSTEIQNFGGGLYGYSYVAAGRQLRWGLGHGTVDDDSIPGVHLIKTVFSLETGSAAGVLGDSGGGYFQRINGEWVLVGLIVGNAQHKRDVAAIFSDYTVAIDLGAYADEIGLAMIPEPGTVGLFFIGATTGGWIWNGRRPKRRRA